MLRAPARLLSLSRFPLKVLTVARYSICRSGERTGSDLIQRIKGEISAVLAAQVGHWRFVLGPRLTLQCVERWVREDLLKGRRVVRIHPRVSRVLKYLRETSVGTRTFRLQLLPKSLVFAHHGSCMFLRVGGSSYPPLYSLAPPATGIL